MPHPLRTASAGLPRPAATWLSIVLGALLLGLPAAGPAHASPPGSDPAPATQPVSPASLAEEPDWPIGLRLPDELLATWEPRDRDRAARQQAAHILVWTPPGAADIRAVLLVPNNSDCKILIQHKRLRDVATRQRIAIVYLREFGRAVLEWAEPPEKAEASFTALLALVADAAGRPEIRQAPWITLGKSSRGRFPFRAAWWFPDRVIASISYHGETPTWPMPAWTRMTDQSILHLNIQGLSEWDGTWYRHVRPALLNYHRNTNWLCHQLVLYSVDHGNYSDSHGTAGWGHKVPPTHISCRQVWDYVALFIDRAMDLRVPKDANAADGPVKLLPVDRSSGFLIHPRAPEELLGLKWFAFRQSEAGGYSPIPWPDEKTPVYDPEQGTISFAQLVRPAAGLPAEQQRDYLWVPDRVMLEAWLDLHNLYKTKDRVLEGLAVPPAEGGR